MAASGPLLARLLRVKDFINSGVGQPYIFDGAEALTDDDHAELHKGVAEANIQL